MRAVLRYIVITGLTFASLFVHSPTFAQERCATVPYSKSLYPNYELKRIAFEQWITEKKIQRRGLRRLENQTTAYKIPVVVHVIHNGEPVGQGANIPEAQILSQLRVLNEDFTRTHADATNTPPEFAAVAGSLNIEFVLAQQDPDGLPTNGIVRVDGGRSGWRVQDNYTLKALSYWPAEEYMNIWVCNLSDQYVGFAQHPESDLEGLENASTNRLTDGVVIWHRAFGSTDDGAFSLDPVFNKGRTTTHEVGHFLGLFHVWGDDAGCSGTDYVEDTPNQANRTQGCPTHPRSDACSEAVMFQNFLDYTDDACMNLFTQGQVDRMTIVLENSPRRKSLLMSPALQPPLAMPNDIGIRNIVFPDASVCSNEIIPVIEVRNYGNNPVTSAEITFIVNGVTIETLNFALSLDPGASTEISFSSLSIPSGTHNVTFEVISVNGGDDSGSYNDDATANVVIPTFASAPLDENFSTSPEGWITENPDGQITWGIATAPHETTDNQALRLSYYYYEDRIGEIDVFLSPVFDLTAAPAATLTFDVAHARYQNSNDRLQVVVLTDCQSVLEGTTVYNKAGDTLKTAPSTTSPFTPSGPSQWRRETIDLSAFIGRQRVQIAFVGINDWGNNLYIDNISLSTDARWDIALVALTAPSVVTCSEDVAPLIRVGNTGTVPFGDLTISYAVNNGTIASTTFRGLNLPVGAQRDIALPSIFLQPGENTLYVNLMPADGSPDDDESNNERTFMLNVNNSQDRIPLREDFEGGLSPMWTVANPQGEGATWETIQTNFGQSLYYPAFGNDDMGAESWFVSPVLDFSRTTQASMLFDLSYNPKAAAPQDELAILVSSDCGRTFTGVPFNFPETGFSEDAWHPSGEEHWSVDVPVDLRAYAGHDSVRVAFVIRNRGGNNLFLDNIEFFLTSDPTAIAVESLYTVYGYDLDHPELTDLRITFDLPERQHVRFSVVNALGQTETDGMLPDVLNQTFSLGLRHRLPPGVYYIRMEIGGRFHATRILLP